MIELVIVSRLLEYPDAALWQHQQELFDALASSENLDKEDAQTLGVFLHLDLYLFRFLQLGGIFFALTHQHTYLL